MMITLLACLLPITAGPRPLTADPFQPLAFLVGSFSGPGQSQMGPYQETFEGRRGVGGTILEVRSTSKAGSMTVFQDLRVFSYDRVEKQLRCRQFAFGAVATYDVEVSTGGQKVVLTEEHFEGGTRAPWRYTYTAISKKGFSYAVHTKRGDVWRPYVSGTLKRAPQK